MLESGQKAPDFTLADDRGGTFRLSDHRGRPVVVEFYCDDGTDGCLIENKEFSDLMSEFEKLGTAVVSISPQDVASHRKFSAANGFRQPLLADTELKANKAYGVWQLKKLWGREYMGTIRTTFVIDAQGRVTDIIKAQRIKGHAQKVLDAVKGLVSASS
jgi:peroxiredoxin Q/BCP